MELLLGAIVLVTTTMVSGVLMTTKTIKTDDVSDKIELEIFRQKLINKMK